MMQLYSKKNLLKPLNPKTETIRFLLDYSKSFRVVKTKNQKTIELYLN